MSSGALYLLLFAALLGAAILFWKWRRTAQLGARLAAAAVSGSLRQLQAMRSEGHPKWVRETAGACIASLEERDALRHRAEDRELFQTLLDEIGHGFLIVNPDLEVRFANKVIARFFPAPGTGRDRRLIEVVHDHRLVDVVRQALQKKKRCSAMIPDEGSRSDK